MRAARVEPPKSHWANPLETPPFYAYPVTCGITFTFGGLRADVDGRVLTESGHPIPGLFVCGEALGGLFSGNYPGGSGLAAGMVFVFKAGTLSGWFYYAAAAMFAIAIPMALIGPTWSPVLFGAVSAASFFIPGLKYYRQRLRGRNAE